MIAVTDRLWLFAIALLLDALRSLTPLAALPGAAAIERIGGRLATVAAGAGRPTRRAAGAALAILAALIGIAAGLLIERLLVGIPYGGWGIAVIAALLLGGGSRRRLTAIRRLLMQDDSAAAGRLVSRDAERLDSDGAIRTAIETGGSRFAETVVAPALWFAVLGLPGLFAERIMAALAAHGSDRDGLGWFADQVNGLMTLPGRWLAAIAIALASPLAGGRPGVTLTTILADAPDQNSRDAWPLAAMAGALGVALGGASWRGGRLVPRAWINADGRRALTAADITRALRLLDGARAVLVIVATVLALGL